VLDKPKGEDFVVAALEAFYSVAKRLQSPATADETLLALGKKFCSLEIEPMRKILIQTKFYSSPDEGLVLFQGEQLKQTMDKVVTFCIEKGILTQKPKISFGEKTPETSLRFDPSYLSRIK
jgi:hypothetical protein